MRKKGICSVLAAVVCLLALGAFTVTAASGSHIKVVSTAPVSAETVTGGLYTMDLSEIFTDTEGHAMTYTLAEGDYGSQTKITADGKLAFSVASEGTYQLKITATCPEKDTAVWNLRMVVKKASEGTEDQYDYDETDAEEVTVYVTVSNDGIPVLGNDEDGTILSHLKVTVPYFDLEAYGLTDYYRYHTTDGSGPYVDRKIVKRPTALHLYIYLMERYYMGIQEDQCGTGAQNPLEYSTETVVRYMDGEPAYDSGGKMALKVRGSATSLYMVNFWGHDENLMYYRNHVYPLMSPGWGSTCDYMLLSDNDTIDVAMFSNWNFYQYGAFTNFDKDSYQVAAESPLEFQTLKYETKSVSQGGSESFVPITGLNVEVYDDSWQQVDVVNTDNQNLYKYTFPSEGTYYLMATDPNPRGNDACFAPATARVEVLKKGTEPVEPEQKRGDVNGDGKITKTDAVLLYRTIKGSKTVWTEQDKAIMDINQDGKITILDVSLLYAYLAGVIKNLP